MMTDEAASVPPTASTVEQPGFQLETIIEPIFAPAMSPVLVTTGLVIITRQCSPALVVES